jgi:hypothetical protein
MADPKEDAFRVRGRSQCTCHGAYDYSYFDSYSSHGPQYISKTTEARGLQSVWLGRHFLPAKSAHFELALWKWRMQKREES